MSDDYDPEEEWKRRRIEELSRPNPAVRTLVWVFIIGFFWMECQQGKERDRMMRESFEEVYGR